jgi:hypothetical protein
MAIEAERGEEDVEDGARKAYRGALRVRPDYALAHYRLGLARPVLPSPLTPPPP